MKQRFMLIAAMMLTMITAGAQTTAKPAVTYGVRLSMDVTIPGSATSIYSNGAGFSLGGVAKISMPKHFFFEPGLFFSYTGMNSKDLVTFNDDYYYQDAAKFYGLRIPINVGYDINLSPQWVMSVATGPYMNLNLSSQQQLTPNMSVPDPLPDRKINLFDNGWKRVDAGWSINLSMTFAENYHLGLSTGLAFTPLAKYGDKDKKIRVYRETISVSLGYNF